MILCEKPLAMNSRRGEAHGQGRREGQGAEHGVVQLPPHPGGHPRQVLIDEGKLGKIFHYRAKFLQDWTISADVPQGGPGTWRLDASRSPAAASPATCSRTASTPRCG
jgi:predicted dehydrogenase